MKRVTTMDKVISWGVFFILVAVTGGNLYYGLTQKEPASLVLAGLLTVLLYSFWQRCLKRNRRAHHKPTITPEDEAKSIFTNIVVDEVITEESLCSRCLSPLETLQEGDIKVGRCTKCGQSFTNVVPSGKGLVIKERMREFRDITPR